MHRPRKNHRPLSPRTRTHPAVGRARPRPPDDQRKILARQCPLPVAQHRDRYRDLASICLTFTLAARPCYHQSSFQVPADFSSAIKISFGGIVAVKIGINGFGRIGRNVLRTALADKNLDFVAVNDLTDPKTLAHLLKYDSILANLPHKITPAPDSISTAGQVIKVFKAKDP